MFKAACAALALSFLTILVAGCLEMQEDRSGNLQSVGLPGVPIWKAEKPVVTAQTQQLDSSAAANADWLSTLNKWREMAGVRPVGENSNLSHGCELHAQYLVNQMPPGENDPGDLVMSMGADMHHEANGRDGFTEEGAQAAVGGRHVQGVIQAADVSWSEADGKADIDGLLVVPFHRLSLLAPWAKVAGFGRAGTAPRSAAALAIRGPEADASAAREISFPPANSTVPIGAMKYLEWPNPLSACPGYHIPVGLPVTLQLGKDQPVSLSDYSFSDETENRKLEACAFDSAGYSNPDPGQRAAAVKSLTSFGAVVLIPREPLQTGHTYRVTLNVNGANDSWTFTVQAVQQTASGTSGARLIDRSDFPIIAR